MQILTKKQWSPYISGIIIGLLQAPLVLLLNKTLGASSALTGCAYELHTFFVKNACTVKTLNTHIWQIGLVIGILIGARLSANWSNIHRPSISSVWENEFGLKSKTLRYSMSFFGGIFLIFGARLANGCTSGNGISGTAQLDVSSWIVLVSMFLSAIGTTFFIKILSGRKEK